MASVTVRTALLYSLARSKGATAAGGAIRHYHPSPISQFPTAIARAERAADLKKHPEAAVTQEKAEDRNHNRHWSEEKATPSEADVSLADERYFLSKADNEAFSGHAGQGGSRGPSRKGEASCERPVTWLLQ